jgi:hypothetical protein
MKIENKTIKEIREGREAYLDSPSRAAHQVKPNTSPATPIQPDPVNVSLKKNKKKKRSYFFFSPEIDTEEELAGHVLDADMDDLDAKIMSRIRFKLLRVRGYL